MSTEAIAGEEQYSEPVAYPGEEKIPYTREDLIRDLQLRSTEIKLELKNFIIQAHFRKKCKEAWILYVNELFDPNTFLSNNPDLELPVINKEISKIKLKIPCSKNDIRQPHYISLEAASDDHFYRILTRTSGEKRERLLQEYTLSSRQRVEQVSLNPAEEQTSKKRGFWSFR